MNHIQELIKKVESRNKKNSFTVSSNLSDALFDGNKLTEITYSEDDLTKNYVKFLTDVFNDVFGEVTLTQVEALGDSIKTNPSEFRESYQKKKSVIKEITKGVFIHTSMNSDMMKIKISNMVESFKGKVTWAKDLSDMQTGNLEWTLTKEMVETQMGKTIDVKEFDLFAKHFHNNLEAQIEATLESQVSNWDEIKTWELFEMGIPNHGMTQEQAIQKKQHNK